jgi:hypothetical protein
VETYLFLTNFTLFSNINKSLQVKVKLVTAHERRVIVNHKYLPINIQRSKTGNSEDKTSEKSILLYLGCKESWFIYFCLGHKYVDVFLELMLKSVNQRRFLIIASIPQKHWVSTLCPSSGIRKSFLNRSSVRNVMFSGYLEYRAMNRNPVIQTVDAPSSEPFRIDVSNLRYYLRHGEAMPLDKTTIQRTFLLLLKPHFICNLYKYIQQIGVRIGCYGLRRGTHECPYIVIRVMSLVKEIFLGSKPYTTNLNLGCLHPVACWRSMWGCFPSTQRHYRRFLLFI